MDLEKDFYETIDCVHEDGLISGKFIIYESDAKKDIEYSTMLLIAIRFTERKSFKYYTD